MQNIATPSLAFFASGDRPDAPTIVFLHGIGVSSWMWQDQIDALCSDYHCLAIDLPGSGDSYEMEWKSHKQASPLIADVIRTQAHGGKAHVVGLSLGGFVALQLIADFPELILSAVISGVSTRPFNTRWLYRPVTYLMGPLMRSDRMISSFVKQMSLPPDTAAKVYRDVKRLKPATFQRCYEELIDFDLETLLHGQAPVRMLITAGEEESTTILNGLTDSLSLQPTSNRAVVKAPHGHHGWSFELPDLFTAMVRAWVENKPLPSALIPVR